MGGSQYITKIEDFNYNPGNTLRNPHVTFINRHYCVLKLDASQYTTKTEDSNYNPGNTHRNLLITFTTTLRNPLITITNTYCSALKRTGVMPLNPTHYVPLCHWGRHDLPPPGSPTLQLAATFRTPLPELVSISMLSFCILTPNCRLTQLSEV